MNSYSLHEHLNSLINNLVLSIQSKCNNCKALLLEKKAMAK